MVLHIGFQRKYLRNYLEISKIFAADLRKIRRRNEKKKRKNAPIVFVAGNVGSATCGLHRGAGIDPVEKAADEYPPLAASNEHIAPQMRQQRPPTSS